LGCRVHAQERRNYGYTTELRNGLEVNVAAVFKDRNLEEAKEGTVSIHHPEYAVTNGQWKRK